MHLRRPARLSSAAGLLLALVAAVTLVSHFPAAARALHDEAKAAEGRNDLGGALAAADSAEIHDLFVRDAVTYLPRNARYVVALPANEAKAEQTYSVDPITFAAVPSLLQNFLLPRRMVTTAERGTYILCYYCERSRWGARVRWLANDGAGGFVGHVSR